MRAIPPPSPSTIMTPLATFQNMPSHSPQSQSMPPHSVSSPQSPTFLYRCPVVAPGQQPQMFSMTAPHTERCPMATALLPFMPTAHGQPVLFTLSPSPLTPYYRSTHMRSLSENTELRLGEKKTLVSLTVCLDLHGT